MEEEKASLAKEASPPAADADTTEACIPGTIDQQPIILDVQKKSLGNLKNNQGTGHNSKIGGSDKPASKQPKPKRVQIPGAPAELTKTTEFVDFAERHSAPYSFTPKREPRSSPTDSGYSSSSDPQLLERWMQARGLNEVSMSNALRGQGRTRERYHERHSSGLSKVDDSPKNTLPLRSEGREYCQDKSTASETSRRSDRGSAREPSVVRPRPAAIKLDALHSSRRGTDTVKEGLRTVSSSRGRGDDVAKTPLLATLAARNNTSDNLSDTRSDTSSRPSSPVPITHTADAPSPRSPKTSYRKRSDETRASRSSANFSHAGSRHASRASSPVEMRRSSTFPSLVEERSHRPRPSYDSTCSLDGLAPRDAYAPYPETPKASALPYPVDDVCLMPSEEDHQYRPHGADSPASPSLSRTHDEASSVVLDSRSRGGNSVPSRPRLPSRHTANEALPKLRTSNHSAEDVIATSPTSVKSAKYRAPKQPPPCPKPKSTRGSDDWYTLDGLPDFDICRDCLYNNFDSTPFRDYFRRSKPKDTKQKTKCDFANQWIRLAWLMTQQQQRKDLDLVYAVAKIGLREGPCPGNHYDRRTWYTLMDRNGETIEHFEVCKTDVKRIEALMPQLHDIFVSAYSEKKDRKCHLQTQSHRFEKYVDVLCGIVEKAEIKRKPPDVQQFVDFVHKMAQIQECKRGVLLRGSHWHIMPHLPEFTVCEECYTDVVWPEIENGSPVAANFQKTPQLISNGEEWLSCQLYSTRMRSIFAKAAMRNDFQYLAWRARERKTAEHDLRNEQHSCKRLQKKLEEEGLKPSDMAGLTMKIENLARDWEKFE